MSHNNITLGGDLPLNGTSPTPSFTSETWALSLVLGGYLLWQWILRKQIFSSSCTEPPMLPYLIPGIGHSFSFVIDAQRTLNYAKNYFSIPSQPFSVLIGGRKTYVLLDPRHIAESYKKTTEMNFDAFLDQIMITSGVSAQSRKAMWAAVSDDTNLTLPNSIRSWVRHDLLLGEHSKSLYSCFLRELDHALSMDAHPSPATHSLLQWTANIICTVSTNAMFGSACLDHSPDLPNYFSTFNHHAWMLLFRYPKILSRTAHVSKERCLEALTRYFDLPLQNRPGAAPFVLQSETNMRENGITSKDIGALMFQIYWALAGSSSNLEFWLMANILFNDSLHCELREEVAPAFENGIHSQPNVEYLLRKCPKLNATFHETLRVHGGASAFRSLAEDAVIGGYELKRGADVMVPYRLLHMDQSHWGPTPEIFSIQKFLEDPKLVNSRAFRPWGGGIAFCPGRFLAQQVSLTCIATILTRFEVNLDSGAGAQRFPQVDDCKPTLGILSPKPGNDLRISIQAIA